MSWTEVSFPDEKNYYLEGARLLREQGLSFFLSSRSLWNAPLPIFVAYLAAGNILIIKILNFVLLNLAALFAWDISRKLFGERVALFSLAAIVFHVPVAQFGPTALSEPLFLFFLLASLWTFLRGLVKQRVGLVVLAGLLFGVSALSRQTVQYFPFLSLLLGLLGLVAPVRGFFQKHEFRSLVLFSLAALLLIVPWSAKNAYLFGRFTIATGSGAVLYLGNDLRKDGDEPVYSEMSFDTIEVTRPYSHLDPEGDSLLLERAKQMIQKHPLDISLLTGRKVIRYLFGNPDSYFFPSSDGFNAFGSLGWKKASLAWYRLILTTVVVGLGLFGLVLFARGSFLGGFTLLLSLYFVFLHAIAFPIPRLALPLYFLSAPFFGSALLAFNKSQRNFVIGLVGLLLVGIGFGPTKVASPEVSERSLSYFPSVHPIRNPTVTLKDLTTLPDGTFSRSGPRPTVEISFEPEPALKNSVLFIPILISDEGRSSNASERIRIFWSLVGSGFSKHLRKDLSVSADGNLHLYRWSPSLSPHWTGEFDRLRLTLPRLSENARFAVGSLRIGK